MPHDPEHEGQWFYLDRINPEDRSDRDAVMEAHLNIIGTLRVNGEEVGSGPGGAGTLETPTGDADGVNDEFVFSAPPVAVFKNGILMDEGDDFTLAGSTVTFLIVPENGDKIRGLV